MSEKLSTSEVLLKMRQQIEREKFGSPISMKMPIGPDGVIRNIWNAIHYRPKAETFHEFIIKALIWTVGKSWHEAQVKLPSEERHVIMKWYYAFGDLTQSILQADHKPGDVRQATLTGEVKELLVLADDMYRLQLVRKLPRKLVDRLRSYDAFQGARYEIAIAATFVRCGFEIEWVEEKSKKHCEFKARQKATGEVIAVETKSRHRPGVLNRKGNAQGPESLRANIQSLFNQALEQNPGDVPFGIFIDVNMPHESNMPLTERRWVKDVREILVQYPEPTTETPSPYTFLVTTNFAWHFEGRKTAYGTEALFTVAQPSKHPLRDVRTYQVLIKSLDNYGKVSNEE